MANNIAVLRPMIESYMLPDYCYSPRTRTNEGNVIHYISGRYVDPTKRFDVDTVIRLLIDLNRPHAERQWYKMLEMPDRMHASYHYIIPRYFTPIQLVPLDKTAWHAGVSQINGRKRLNEWTTGIALIADQDSGFTDHQYTSLAQIVKMLGNHPCWGHDQVAQGRKHDPGEYFNWDRLNKELTNLD